MFNYIWPVALIVLSDTFYSICTKSSPADMNPMAALTVTYFIGMVGSLAMFFILSKDGSLMAEYRKLNWAPFVLGLVIIGLEVGSIYAYRFGWQVNTLPIVKGAILAIVLIFVGRFVFHEAITWNKIVGIVLCMAGIVFIRSKLKINSQSKTVLLKHGDGLVLSKINNVGNLNLFCGALENIRCTGGS